MHVVKLKRYQGEITPAWEKFKESLKFQKEIPHDTNGTVGPSVLIEPVVPQKFKNMTSVDVELPKRQVRTPKHIQDFVCHKKMFNCTLQSVTDERPPCAATHGAESGIRRHMVTVHHTRFSRHGNHNRLEGEELARVTEQDRLAQMNSAMLKCHRASDAGGGSRTELLRSYDV